MNSITTPVIATLASIALLPFGAKAGPTATKLDTQSDVTVAVNTDTSAISQTTLYAVQDREEVLSTSIRENQGDLIPVRDQDGEIYYNHILEPEDLTEVDFDLDVINTYEFTYQGRTYVNKIVELDD